MKKLIVVATLLALTSLPAHAETVRTCSSYVYGGGEVCGETTTLTHEVASTGISDIQMIKFLAGLGVSAVIATGLYKLTYKSYILG